MLQRLCHASLSALFERENATLKEKLFAPEIVCIMHRQKPPFPVTQPDNCHFLRVVFLTLMKPKHLPKRKRYEYVTACLGSRVPGGTVLPARLLMCCTTSPSCAHVPGWLPLFYESLFKMSRICR
jgi:hypothetical protein